MFDLETIDKTHSRITSLSSSNDKAKLLHHAVEIIAEMFDAFFVAVYLPDEQRKFVVMNAGSGKYGQRLVSYLHKVKIAESGNFWEQAGAAVCLNEIRATILREGKLLAWKTSENNIFPTKISKDVELFVGSPLFAETLMEIFLPLQVNTNVYGVLQISLDAITEFRNDQLSGLQRITNEIAAKLIDNSKMSVPSKTA